MKSSPKRSKILNLARQVIEAYRTAHAEFQATKERLEALLDGVEEEADKLGLFEFCDAISNMLDEPDDWDDRSDIIDALKSDFASAFNCDYDARDAFADQLDELLYEGFDQAAEDECLRISAKRLERAKRRLKRTQKRLQEIQQSPKSSSIKRGSLNNSGPSDFTLDGDSLAEEDDEPLLSHVAAITASDSRQGPLSEDEIASLITEASATCQVVSVAFLSILTELTASLADCQQRLDRLLPDSLRPSLNDHLDDPASWGDGIDLRQDWLDCLEDLSASGQVPVNDDQLTPIFNQAMTAYIDAHARLKPLQARFDTLARRADNAALTMVSLCLEEWMDTPEQWNEFARLPQELQTALAEDNALNGDL